jgi:hypothetical protein
MQQLPQLVGRGASNRLDAAKEQRSFAFKNQQETDKSSPQSQKTLSQTLQD